MTSESWLQAQYSVLGSALIEPGLVPKVIQQTRESDFIGECRTVYRAMAELFQAGTPVDPVSVAATLGNEYRRLLVELMEVTPTAANIDSYIQICREQAKVISIRSIGQSLSTAEDPEQIRKLLDSANVLMVDKPSVRIFSMEDLLKSFYRRHAGEVSYLSWPIPELNDRLYCESGDFILIGGYPSTGKSALSLQCARHWGRSMKVGFFSLETNEDKLFDRMMVSMANVDMDTVKRNKLTEEAWNSIAESTSMIVRSNVHVIPAAGMTPADIKSLTVMHGFQLIIIDYIQLLTAPGINRTEQVTNISLALHRMAQDLRVTVVGLSQLKRKDSEGTPDSSDLRESGQLEQDADVVMILKLEQKNNPDGNRQLFITKNKEGTCPMVTLAFDGKHQVFKKAPKFPAKKNRPTPVLNRPQEEQMTLLPGNTEVPF